MAPIQIHNLTEQGDVLQVLDFQDRQDILNMRVEGDAGMGEMGALPETGIGGTEEGMAPRLAIAPCHSCLRPAHPRNPPHDGIFVFQRRDRHETDF